MKKLILLSVTMMALSAGAATRLEDIVIVINARSSQPVTISAGPSAVVYQAPMAYQTPVVYNSPVVYTQPVIYQGPVFYNSEVAPTVVYNPDAAPVPSYFADYDSSPYSGCGYNNLYSGCDYYSSAYRCNSYCNPNLIRFGHIQAVREGYHFGRRR